MDLQQLLDVPHVAPDAKAAGIKSLTDQGYQMNYKSCYLDTLEHNKAPMTSTPRFKPDDSRNSMTRYEDVHGTKPNPLPHCRIKSDGLHDVELFPKSPYFKEPVEGAQVKLRKLKEPRIMSSLTTSDIEGAHQVEAMSGRKSMRECDPLQPVYKLQGFQPEPPYQPKFVRDSIACDDINAKNANRKLFSSYEKGRLSSTMDATDIQGTISRARIRERSKVYTSGPGLQSASDSLAARDITDITERLPFHFKRSGRHIDPLVPEYRYNVPPAINFLNSRLTGEKGMETTQQVKDDWYIGPVDRQASKRFATGAVIHSTPGMQGDITYREHMLRTEDVDGAQHGTKGRFQSSCEVLSMTNWPEQRVTPFYRTQFGMSNHNADIEGAQPKGPFTLLPAHFLTKRAAERDAASTSAPAGPPQNQSVTSIAPEHPAPAVTQAAAVSAPTGPKSPQPSPKLAINTNGGLESAMKSSPKPGNGGTMKSTSFAPSPRVKMGTPRSGTATPRGQPSAPALDRKLLSSLASA